MKLATLKDGGRDGRLIVTSRDLARAVMVPPEVTPTLQRALDTWGEIRDTLQKLYDDLAADRVRDAFALDTRALAAPLPRAFQWLDGSAYLSHVELVRKARGASMPPVFEQEPIMYQGGSDTFLSAHNPIVVADEAWGADFEAELAVITGDVPMGCTREQAAASILLLVLVNDVSLRELIPGELAKGFGFLHSKPSSAFAPVAVTLDELGDAWNGSSANLELTVELNGERFGSPNAATDMHFDFPRLIQHAARTRALSAGTILGAGTVSNHDRRAGACCIAERRAIEMIECGAPHTPWLRHGDWVRIDARDRHGSSIFGAIDQRVTPRSLP